MPLLSEIGSAVRQRRQEMGLTQDQLAQLAELSRATINELEGGRLGDLSSRRIERLANELGLAIGIVTARRGKTESAIANAARIASVPYQRSMPPEVLEEAIREGALPPQYIPHIRTLLDEAPVGVLADLADHIESASGIGRKDTWKRMRTLAAVLKCGRPMWALQRT